MKIYEKSRIFSTEKFLKNRNLIKPLFYADYAGLWNKMYVTIVLQGKFSLDNICYICYIRYCPIYNILCFGYMNE